MTRRPDTDRVLALERLGAKIKNCPFKCSAWRDECPPVLWTGNPYAKLMCRGESPGKEEVKFGAPFVGNRGEELEKWFLSYGLDRHTDLFLSNAIHCRPCVMGARTFRNRRVWPGEWKTCRGFAVSEIEIVQPEVILCIGEVSAKQIIGERFEFKTDGGRLCKSEYFGIPAVGIYHPGWLQRLEKDPRPGKPEEYAQAKEINDSGFEIALELIR